MDPCEAIGQTLATSDYEELVRVMVDLPPTRRPSLWARRKSRKQSWVVFREVGVGGTNQHPGHGGVLGCGRATMVSLWQNNSAKSLTTATRPLQHRISEGPQPPRASSLVGRVRVVDVWHPTFFYVLFMANHYAHYLPAYHHTVAGQIPDLIAPPHAAAYCVDR